MGRELQQLPDLVGPELQTCGVGALVAGRTKRAQVIKLLFVSHWKSQPQSKCLSLMDVLCKNESTAVNPIISKVQLERHLCGLSGTSSGPDVRSEACQVLASNKRAYYQCTWLQGPQEQKKVLRVCPGNLCTVRYRLSP
jgi:hypothetical protein